MTATETQVVADAVLFRTNEQGTDLWVRFDDDHLPEAFSLSERGVLDRRWDRDREPVFRLSDSALLGYQLGTYASRN